MPPIFSYNTTTEPFVGNVITRTTHTDTRTLTHSAVSSTVSIPLLSLGLLCTQANWSQERRKRRFDFWTWDGKMIGIGKYFANYS